MREACVKHVADAIAACYRRAWTSPDEMRGATGALKRLAVSMANLPLPPAPAPRCPYFSRAWGVQCDRPVGHDGNCQSGGDGFAPGYTPAPNEKMRCSACPEPGSDDRPCDSFVHATPPAPDAEAVREAWAWEIIDKDGAKMLDHPFRSREAAEAVKRECEVWRWPARAPFTLRPLYAAPLPASRDDGGSKIGGDRD